MQSFCNSLQLTLNRSWPAATHNRHRQGSADACRQRMRQGTDLHASLVHFPPSVVTCWDNPATKTEAAKNETRLNLLSHRSHVTLFLTTEALDIVEALLLLGGWLAPALAFTPRLLCGTWLPLVVTALAIEALCGLPRPCGSSSSSTATFLQDMRTL